MFQLHQEEQVPRFEGRADSSGSLLAFLSHIRTASQHRCPYANSFAENAATQPSARDSFLTGSTPKVTPDHRSVIRAALSISSVRAKPEQKRQGT
jgi:hypothetical protein